jgi:hypothetical protein
VLTGLMDTGGRDRTVRLAKRVVHTLV